MKGVIGKFFLQFGVTLCVAVLLSYLEAVTLAPARCAQMLVDVAGRPEPHRPVMVDRASTRARDALRAHAPARRCAGRASCSLGPRPCFVLAVVHPARPAGRVRAVAGPEPPHGPAADRGRLGPRGDRPAVPARRELHAVAGPRWLAHLRRSSAAAAAGVNTGMIFVTLVPPAEREMTQAEFSAVVAQGAQLLSGPAGGRAGPVAVGLHRAARLPGRVLRPRPGLGQARRPSSEEMQPQARRERPRRRPGHRLPGRHARAAHPPRPRARRGPRRLHRGGGHDAQRAGRRPPGRQVQLGRPAHGRADAPAGRPALAARGPRPGCACGRSRASWCRCRRSSRPEERPALQAITRRDRERAITIFANVAPGHSQDEALAKVEELASDAARWATASVLGGASRGLPGVDGRACSSRSSSASSSRTWCWRRSSTRSCTRSRC